MPAQERQTFPLRFVSRYVVREFCKPFFFVGLRNGRSFAAFVSVPEAAVDEDDGFVLRQDNVGMTGQCFRVEAEAEAAAVEPFADDELGLRVFGADAGHDSASDGFRYGVHGCSAPWTSFFHGSS